MRLEGTKVLLSGEFATERDALEKALTERGATIATGIAPDVEVVFAGENPTGDVDAARELGVRIEDEKALAAALAGEEAPPKPAPPVAAPVTSPPGEPNAPGSAPAGEGRQFDKGERVRIVGGREGVGEFGEIFWWGESKFGDGMRAGVTAEDGTKYWVDEENLAWPDEDVDEEALQEAIEANVFGRGDRVRVKSGKEEGAEGEIFWWGESKWGDGMRAGIETDDGEKVWVDAEHLDALEDDEEDSDIPF